MSTNRESLQPGRFGVARNYEWLRGRLEYAEAIGQWRIRYLSPEQSPDPYGGVVAIDNPQVLANLRSGDFVAVQGELLEAGASSQFASASYRLSIVQRQR
jgi:hypothetical protein